LSLRLGQQSGKTILLASDSSPWPGIRLGRLLVGSSGGNLKPAQEESSKVRITSEVLFTRYHTLHTFRLDVHGYLGVLSPTLIPLPAERSGQSAEWRPPIRSLTLLSSGSIEARRR
jgi:hypothetical protein